MDIKESSDIAQEVMENLFCDLDDVEVYIDDIGCFLSPFSMHRFTLNIILPRLQQNSFTVNPSKCEWAVQETGWLGYWPTPCGLKPWYRKIKAITVIQAPINIKQVCSFMGAVKYYHDLWPRCSHILAPLNPTSILSGWASAFMEATTA